MSDDSLHDRISSLSDEEIIRMVAVDSAQYRKEALDYAHSEVEARGLSLEGIDSNETSQLSSNSLAVPLGRTLVLFALFISLPLWFIKFIQMEVEKRLGAETSFLYPLRYGILFSLASLCLVFYIRHSIYKRRIQAPLATELLAESEEKPILYLRSFNDDPGAAQPIGWTTEEEQLAMAFNDIGPFVAIGRPGDKLPQVGAARLYVRDARWRETISTLMSQSQLVVLRIGLTEGFWWEVQRVVEGVEPERIVFLVPANDQIYENFRNLAARYFTRPLPEKIPSAIKVGSLSGVIYFEPDWTSHYIQFPMERGIFSRYEEAPERSRIAAALQPVFEQIQLRVGDLSSREPKRHNR